MSEHDYPSLEKRIKSVECQQIHLEEKHFRALDRLYAKVEDLCAQNNNENIQAALLKAVDENASLRAQVDTKETTISCLEEELATLSSSLLHAQAELSRLYRQSPKAKLKRLAERLGFFMSALLPIRLLRLFRQIVSSARP